MNRLIGILIGFFLASTVFADENDFRCLKSVGFKKSIRIQFVHQTGKVDVGYVKYESGTGHIQVKRIKERVLGSVSGGRPSEIETTWQEVLPNATGGTYVVVSQGALMQEFKYIRQDGKVFRFEDDPDASGESSCEWSSR